MNKHFFFSYLAVFFLIPIIYAKPSANIITLTQTKPVHASVEFKHRKLRGSFKLFDNQLDSGTQITGFWKTWRKNAYEYAFFSYIHANCSFVEEDTIFETDVTDAFTVQNLDEDKSHQLFKRTDVSWLYRKPVESVVVAYETRIAASGAIRYQKITCAPVVHKHEQPKLYNSEKFKFK
ncbi:1245_t:CDS:2, partial [Ambispora gerdemannii]